MSYHDIDETLEDGLEKVLQQQCGSAIAGYQILKGGAVATVETAKRIEILVDGYDYELQGDYYVTGNVWADIRVSLVDNIHDTTRDEFRAACGALSALFRGMELPDLLNNCGQANLHVFGPEAWRPSRVDREMNDAGELRKNFRGRLYCCSSTSAVG